jgi:hypothetical protein
LHGMIESDYCHGTANDPEQRRNYIPYKMSTLYIYLMDMPYQSLPGKGVGEYKMKEMCRKYVPSTNTE